MNQQDFLLHKKKILQIGGKWQDIKIDKFI